MQRVLVDSSADLTGTTDVPDIYNRLLAAAKEPVGKEGTCTLEEYVRCMTSNVIDSLSKTP
jgi:hypothetical protein